MRSTLAVISQQILRSLTDQAEQALLCSAHQGSKAAIFP
jgi:hypothetical protein